MPRGNRGHEPESCVFQLILGDQADLGNESLLDAVVQRVRNDAPRSDIFTASTAV